MCLSTVYLEDRREDTVVVKEAASVIDRGGRVEIKTLFGEKKEVEDFVIQEVNLVKNYVILKRRDE